jgi:hypothetical protein
MLRCEEIFKQICWLEQRFWPDVDGMGEEIESSSARMGSSSEPINNSDFNSPLAQNMNGNSNPQSFSNNNSGMNASMNNQMTNGLPNVGMNAQMNGPMGSGMNAPQMSAARMTASQVNGSGMNGGDSTPATDGSAQFQSQ